MNITRPVANGLNKRRVFTLLEWLTYTQFSKGQLSVPPGDSSKHPSQLPDKMMGFVAGTSLHHSFLHSFIHSVIDKLLAKESWLLWKLAQHSNIQFGWRASPQLAKTLETHVLQRVRSQHTGDQGSNESMHLKLHSALPAILSFQLDVLPRWLCANLLKWIMFENMLSNSCCNFPSILCVCGCVSIPNQLKTTLSAMSPSPHPSSPVKIPGSILRSFCQTSLPLLQVAPEEPV